MEIKTGRVYRAKKPEVTRGYYNDRQVIFVGVDKVQYDSPAVHIGRRYPTISIEKFKEWAGEDVTEKLPAGEWQRYVTKSQVD